MARTDPTDVRVSGEILVVGAGPVGLAMACELRRHGVPCRIVDAAEGPTDQSRALGIQARTLEVFDLMGVVAPVLAGGRRIHGVAAYAEGRRIAHVTFDLDGLDTPYPFLLILPQGRTQRHLIAHLEGQGGAVEWRKRLTSLHQDEGGVTATLADPDGWEHEARFAWLVGCDGAHSAVRHSLGLNFEGAAYPETFLLADAPLAWDQPEDEARILLTTEGAVALFPFPEPGRWRLIDTTGRVVTGDPAQIADRFRELLHANGHPEAIVGEPTWATSFRIHRRAVDRMRAGRCFVAGDAAHIHSPAGGQGMNTGIQDAFNLAWKLALVHADAAPEALLDSYQAERHPVAADVLRRTDRATRVITLRNSVAEAVRNRMASLLLEFDFVQRQVARGLSELDIDYRSSPIVAEDRPSLVGSLLPGGPGPGAALDFVSGPRPGDRAPDVRLAPGPGRLFDALRGPRHHLLLFEGTAPDPAVTGPLEAIADLARARSPGRIEVHRVARTGSVTDGPTLVDADGALHRRFGARSACLCLIRPDGYVGYRSQPPDPESFSTYLGRLFLSG